MKSNIIMMLAGGALLMHLATPANSAAYDQSIAAEVATLYGTDSRGAVERISHEDVAAEVYREILLLSVASYAGAWFDPDLRALVVALASPSNSEINAVRQAGAVVTQVSKTIGQLREVKQQLMMSILSHEVLRDAFRAVSVDTRKNTIGFDVAYGHGPSFYDFLRSEMLANFSDFSPEIIEVTEVGTRAHLTSSIPGAEGIWNPAFDEYDDQGQVLSRYYFSSGVSIEGGFITAGHTISVGHAIHFPASSQIGVAQGTTWGSSGESGWVQTLAGYTPVPVIDGYADGPIDVPASWSGILEYPVGTTVCRYGFASGGPHCGTIAQKEKIVKYSLTNSDYWVPLTVVSGTCASLGDSGGPHISASGQIQGSQSGLSSSTFCPDSANEVYFWPIENSLDDFSKTALTLHGAVKPQVVGHLCPDFSNSGAFTFYCKIDEFRSQGTTSITWTSNSAPTKHDSTFLSGNCAQGTLVSVTLKVENPYGIETVTSSFQCPSGIIQ